MELLLPHVLHLAWRPPHKTTSASRYHPSVRHIRQCRLCLHPVNFHTSPHSPPPRLPRQGPLFPQPPAGPESVSVAIIINNVIVKGCRKITSCPRACQPALREHISADHGLLKGNSHSKCHSDWSWRLRTWTSGAAAAPLGLQVSPGYE
jgi:hypothetical protein